MGTINLEYGVQSADIKKMQEFLNDNGFYVKTNGVYDEMTEYAANKYIESNNMSGKGVSDLLNGVITMGYSPKVPATEFSFSKQGELENVMNDILYRKPFKYDFNEDAFYQMYKDKFTKQGKMAAEDVMGQVAAMTGGYGNSYAATVGNQAYLNSLDNLNDVIPELYQLALDRYNQEGKDLLSKYGLLDAEFNREKSDYDEAYDKQSNKNSIPSVVGNGYGVDASDIKTLDKAIETETEVPANVIKNVENYTTEKGQADYLANEVNKGTITEDQALDLLNQYGVTDLINRSWEMVDDGDGNLFGIDRNAKVRDENGDEYTLAELRKKLKKTMSTKEANKWIKELEDRLGI